MRRVAAGCAQEFDGASRGNPGLAGSGAALRESGSGQIVSADCACVVVPHGTFCYIHQGTIQACMATYRMQKGLGAGLVPHSPPLAVAATRLDIDTQICLR